MTDVTKMSTEELIAEGRKTSEWYTEGSLTGKTVLELASRLDEILKYLRERCAQTCSWRMETEYYGRHEPNCPVADLGLEEK